MRSALAVIAAAAGCAASGLPACVTVNPDRGGTTTSCF